MINKNVYIDTYGCASNKADSQSMNGLLEKAGYKLTSNEGDADYLILNSCAVKSATEEKIIHRLKEFSKTNKKVIITGCLPKVNPERIKKTIPNFGGMLDPRSIHKVVDIIKEIENGKNNIIQTSKTPVQKPSLSSISFNSVIDIVKISEGCLSNCVFCASKLAREDLYSFRPDVIRDRVNDGLEKGIKEFYLSSEDMSAYGRDIGTSLPELLQSITNIEGNFLIRVGMMNPLHFKKVEISELIEVYKSDKIFKFLHLCVQSGSDSVLNVMKRGYTVEDFEYYVEQFRKAIPDITIWTDVIAAHPGETEEDFNQTVKLLERVKPDFVNISGYGVRKGTEAAKMKQIPSEVKKDRTRKLTEVVHKLMLERNKRWIGWSGTVLVDEFKKERGTWIGRNHAYKPVILKGDHSFGDTVTVKITKAERTHLISD